jgi:peptide/nickel transport system permease protein
VTAATTAGDATRHERVLQLAIAFATRVAVLFASLVAASALIFVLLRVLPGDLAQSRLGFDGSPEALDALRVEYGFDRPLIVQYISWLGDAVRGDLGKSLLSGADVSTELARKSRITLPLVALSGTLAFVIGVPLGMLAGLRAGRRGGAALAALGRVGVAVPVFWVGVLSISVFAVRWRLFPAGGFPDEGWARPDLALRALALPAFSLAVAQGAMLTRFARSATLECLEQEWMLAARATGLSRRSALLIHGPRNVLPPVVAVLGTQVATLVVGAIVVENVFALPGLGRMLIQDVAVRDHLKVQATVVAVTAFVFLVGFLVDGASRLLDPRLRQR